MGKATSWLTSSLLFLIHVVYSLVCAATSLRQFHSTRDPQPLVCNRRQVPAHVAVLFASHDDTALEKFEGDILGNIAQLVAWCRLVGVKRLTVYDRKGAASLPSLSILFNSISLPQRGC